MDCHSYGGLTLVYLFVLHLRIWLSVRWWYLVPWYNKLFLKSVCTKFINAFSQPVGSEFWVRVNVGAKFKVRVIKRSWVGARVGDRVGRVYLM